MIEINPGDLVHKIYIKELTTISDGGGGKAEEWVNYFDNPPHTMASIKQLSGRELFAARQIQSTATHKVEFWYRPGITTKHRVVFGTRIFEIHEVKNVEEKNVKIVLICEEIFNGVV